VGRSFWELPRTRTVSPSVHPRSASGGATGFFRASALRHREVLRPPGAKDARCIRPISATQTNACTRTSCVPGSLSPLARRGRPTESKAPYGRTGGPDVSRRPRTASADPRRALVLALPRAWGSCPHGADGIEPLTPLSRSPVHPRASPGFPGAATLPAVSSSERGRVGGCGTPPRPS